MNGDSQFFFSPFTLDCANRSLFRAGEKVFLRSKSFSVLDYLVEHPHRLVTKEELKQAAWPRAKVVDAALRVSIQEIRRALGDRAEHPQFIETIGKSGYRFVAPVSLRVAHKQGSELTNFFVGRRAELQQLREHLKLVENGRRQLVFITGEPGIGKTTLIDVFANSLDQTDNVIVARGQSIEQYGTAEAYLPVLDILEQLCRRANGELTIAMLRDLAPSWLLNLAAFTSSEERERLSRRCLGMSAERRLHEITTFFELMAKNCTLVLILEDLHWVDPSTIALISFLARRRQAARLLVIGTYRSGEVERFNSPLKAIASDLTLHHLSAQLPLKLLSQSAVEEYLISRFAQPAVSRSLASTVYSRSEGNPLFMVNVTDYLVSHQAIVQDKETVKLADNDIQEPVPTSLRDLINRQFEALPPEDQELVETASVIGMTFPVLLLARLLDREREGVERRCRELSEREQFLQYRGSRKRPSGNTSSLYGFTHALYHSVIYERAGESKRRRLHQAIGNVLERVFQEATEQVAAELALHFERAGDYQQAIKYLTRAAQKAIQQAAYQEAIQSATKGLEFLKWHCGNRQQKQQELELLLALGPAVASTKGYAAAEVGDIYNRADLLSQELADESLRVLANYGNYRFHLMTGQLRRALNIGKQMIVSARCTGDSNSLADAYTLAGVSLLHLGEFSAAQEQFDHAITAYGIRNETFVPVKHPDVLAYSLTYSAINWWITGYPAVAAEKEAQALLLTRELPHPFSTVITLIMLATYHQCRREPTRTLELCEIGIQHAAKHGFSSWLTTGMILKGWALTNLGQQSEGIALLRENLKTWRKIGCKTETARFMFLLAHAYLLANRAKAGLLVVEEALSLVAETGNRYYESELTRLRGELLLQEKSNLHKRTAFADAEFCLVSAIEIARKQKAKSFEVRATTSLARLWYERGNKKKARELLATSYEHFTQAFDTPALKDARELLDAAE